MENEKQLVDINLDLNHNFILSLVDTDSITFSKPDQSEFTEQEANSLLNELNSFFPGYIKLDLEEIFDKILVIKTKNYILVSKDGSLKYKGSALRSPKLEKALNEFIHRMVEAILYEKGGYTAIYNEYVKEIDNISDIKRWSSRYTISSKTLESERTNEAKVREAIENTEYVEGDRIYCFYDPEDRLILEENFKGEYNKERMLEKLYKTSLRFSTILPVKDLFINYKLKKNKKLLEELKVLIKTTL